MVHQRGGITFLWITVAPGRNTIDANFVMHVRTMMNLIVDHAKLYWTKDDDEIYDIELTKFDAARDFHGSFLDKPNSLAYKLMKDKIQITMTDLTSSGITSRLGAIIDRFPTVHNGENNLDSCF